MSSLQDSVGAALNEASIAPGGALLVALSGGPGFHRTAARARGSADGAPAEPGCLHR